VDVGEGHEHEGEGDGVNGRKGRIRMEEKCGCRRCEAARRRRKGLVCGGGMKFFFFFFPQTKFAHEKIGKCVEGKD
jgi:hypothetical protein